MRQLSMRLFLLSFIILFSLSGCQALNFQTEPKRQEDCQYSTMQGIEFQFNNLPINQLNDGYAHIYVAQSKESATLPFQYQGVKGKLAGIVIERYYPYTSFGGNRLSPFRDSLFYDNYYYDDIYLTAQQREMRDRKAKYIFQKAILENCQIVYISVDSMATDYEDPNLIINADLTILHKDITD